MTLSLICLYVLDRPLQKALPLPQAPGLKTQIYYYTFFKPSIMLKFSPTSGSSLPDFTFPFFFTNETQVSSNQTLSFSVKKILQSVGE